MDEAYRTFASYLRFKEVLSDPLGHLDRAGEFDAGGVHRAVWLRIFDRPSIPVEDVIAAFDRAQKIAQSVQSASLPSGATYVADDGTPAAVIDYVASQPLTRVFQRVAQEHFPTPVDNALLMTEKIALALSATLTAEIDGERVLHGFLHPGLIFVSNDGEVTVTAFGVAEQLLVLIDEAESADHIHPYLAPEVLQTRAPSPRGDVYSLGAILFQLLTGQALPTQPDDRIQAIGTTQLAYEAETIPEDIKQLLQRTLAPHPEQRFASAADFKQELDRLLYGGAYSPTTFNLALFMDRLFRAEVEAAESELAREMAVDVGPYFAPGDELEAASARGPDQQRSSRLGQPLWIGLGAVAMTVIAAILWFSIGRGPSATTATPTPTAEEIAAQRLEQEARMRELAEGLVAEMMAEKEEEIRQELLDRQAKIDELQRRLTDSERRARGGQLSEDDVLRQEELQRQIAAEEEMQRQLEVERQQATEEAQRQVMAQQTATAAVEAADLATPTLPPPTATMIPTSVPTPPPTEVVVTVEENSFVDPSEVDTLPVVIKESPVTWPRAALHSQRHGVVILRATVNARGAVEDLEVLRADHEGFGIPQAVMDAVMKYRFKPATKDGVPVKTHATVTKPYRFVTR
jgi:TonB family protein